MATTPHSFNLAMNQVSSLTKIMEVGENDCIKLQLFKLCTNYKVTKDVDVCNKTRDLRAQIYQEFLTANQIFERIVKDDDVFEDESSALYMTEQQVAALQSGKNDIHFMEMVDTNTSRDGYCGDLYSYRARDLLLLNEIDALKKSKGKGSQAYQPLFDQIHDAFTKGLIHKIRDGPKEPIYQPKVEKNTPKIGGKAVVPKESKEVTELKQKVAELEKRVQQLEKENSDLKQKIEQPVEAQ